MLMSHNVAIILENVQSQTRTDALFKQHSGGTKNKFFAVFDGHGLYGHFCARFCVKALPKNIEKEMRKYETENLNYGAVLTSRHMTNEQLRASDNDMHSGTTCCAMLIVGDKCYVANVGDSRAIVARRRRSDDPLKPTSSTFRQQYRPMPSKIHRIV